MTVKCCKKYKKESGLRENMLCIGCFVQGAGAVTILLTLLPQPLFISLKLTKEIFYVIVYIIIIRTYTAGLEAYCQIYKKSKDKAYHHECQD